MHIFFVWIYITFTVQTVNDLWLWTQLGWTEAEQRTYFPTGDCRILWKHLLNAFHKINLPIKYNGPFNNESGFLVISRTYMKNKIYAWGGFFQQTEGK